MRVKGFVEAALRTAVAVEAELLLVDYQWLLMPRMSVARVEADWAWRREHKFHRTQGTKRS